MGVLKGLIEALAHTSALKHVREDAIRDLKFANLLSQHYLYQMPLTHLFLALLLRSTSFLNLQC
jgi:hypothetical protein